VQGLQRSVQHTQTVTEEGAQALKPSNGSAAVDGLPAQHLSLDSKHFELVSLATQSRFVINLPLSTSVW
jgi:hypothetical protein